MLSALQIRYGLPDIMKVSSLTVDYSLFTKMKWLIYYNTPFLLELKSVIDWSFSVTALDMY